MADEGVKKLSKKELKKQMKDEVKESAKAAEQPKEETAELKIGDETTLQYGHYPLVQSARVTTRVFSNIADLDASHDGNTVWVRARLYTSRSKG